MKHNVQFTIPCRDLGKTDVEFQVWGDGEKIGTLEVSRGAVVWYPKDCSYGHKIGWSQFDTVMRKYPRLERR